MGAVGIRIQPSPLDQFVDVGYCHSDDGVWQWQHRWKRGDEDRLVFDQKIDESAELINNAIPKIPDSIMGSPGKFTGWKAIRSTERVPFSLSTRTPRQPALVIRYKCRWCQHKDSENMVLVECEYCRSRGIMVAYHENCLKDAMSGKQIKVIQKTPTVFGGSYYVLKPVIEELMEQRESKDTPILIPAQYEACYQCGVFRNGGRWFIKVKSLDKKVKHEINKRRQECSTLIIGGEVKEVITVEGENERGEKIDVQKEIMTFNIDATLEEFYALQPQFE
jgi:hypothetical protein